MSERPCLRPLTPHSRIAVAAPASAALDAADTRTGLAALRKRGLSVEDGRAFAPAHGYLSGTDADRADELNALLRRPDLDAIVCLRGGYGLLRILDAVDYEAARAHPKWIVGYSDVTALQLALWSQAGLPSLSGPMVASDWLHIDIETEVLFWQAASTNLPYALAGPDHQPLAVLRPGEAEGTLLGGNLALVAALVGTPFFPDVDGAVLFVEDVGEAPYRIDGLLARLRLAGVLDRLGGLVYGAFTDADPLPDRPSFTVDEVLAHYAGFVDGPVVSGFQYGHVPRKATVPIGAQARLAAGADGAVLTVTEPLAVP